jgi:hypothetical protein
MSDQVRISSIDDLERFRGHLIQYIGNAGSALEEMVSEVRRTRTWLDTDRMQHWGSELKKGKKRLEQAEQELYSANLTDPQANHALQKMAVFKAERVVSEVEDKLRLLKQWRLQFDQRTQPLVQQLDRMFSLLSQQLPKGVRSLGESIKALQDYAESQRPLKKPAEPSPQPDTAP